MPDTQFVSVEEFGRRTSLSARSVWRLLERGLLPSLRVGRRRLVPLVAGVDALRGLDSWQSARFPDRTSQHRR
jgi:hypothetical protein